MFRAGGVRRDERQVDGSGSHAGQFDLGFLGRLFQALSRHFILAQVHAVLFLELIGQPVDDAFVEVVAAQVCVTGRGQNLGHAVAHLDDGHVERTTAQVINHDLLVVFFVHAVGQSRCGGLVDDTLYIQTGDGACVLGGLALRVVEVRGNGDDRLGDLLAQIALGVGFQFGQDHGADLLRSVLFAVDLHFVIGAHVTFDGRNGAVGIGDGLTFCHLTYQALAGFGEAHHAGRGARAFGVRNDNGLAALNDGYTAVGCTQVDTNDFSHK